MPDFFRVETVVTYPFAADGAAVKMQMRFQIGLLKSRPMLLFPQYLSCPAVLNAGKPSLPERLFPAFPFLSATVTEKAEAKSLFAGMIRCPTG